ncbi:phosphatidylserine synthase [Thecamonas trahens ATCC 50062]|uniref:Phosphatidylserine synthase n=1 Tax=Thecamonas trahens ATCC 50062 TaxID=461836 RepID=A0A0L0D523_THETB|nr:phosphatidylserine synthase [Thecamonas trahens ATCC 50062]KNC47161.1 phosphatidylserine synthase [Thecamonas trahens ATCC 50062]|eukprot:XP_013759935.1 phosphatidylserine synthase [Thecamonas trahens ATCC 50062]
MRQNKKVMRSRAEAEPVYEEALPMMAPVSKYDAVFQQPHTVTALAAALAAVAWVGFQSEQWGLSSPKLGLLAAAFVFLVFSMLNFSNGPFIRPHPAVWRIVLGISVLYVLALTYLLFQSKADARALMAHLDPVLGVPLPERSYGDDCRLFTPDHPTSYMANLMDALFDEFVIAHALGWMAKMLMLRDFTLCWVLSIFFEILEYSFEHMLPNFGECWWDHFILDVLVCNLLGMVVGFWLVRYLEMKEYNWTGIGAIPSVQGKMQRAALQFTPERWTVYRWEAFSSLKRFSYVIVVIIFIEVNELCAFFLKTLLWIPPPHPINPLRLFVWWLIALPALREFYEFVTNPKCKRFGAQLWVAAAGILLELLLVIKFGQGEFTVPPSPIIVYGWSAFGLFFVGFVIYKFFLFPSPSPVNHPKVD